MRIDLAPDAVARCIDTVGFGFMFAPAHHGATRFVVPVRKELGVRTIFNFLGPLTNPAGAPRQVIGVSDPSFLETVARAAGELGAVRALVFRGDDGLDELSTLGTSQVYEVSQGGVRHYELTPEAVGLPRARFEDVAGGMPAENAEIARRIFAGEAGAPRDLAVLNAGAAIFAAGRADDLDAGCRAAEAALDSGAVASTLDRLIAITQELSEAVNA
ncbi:MAG: anthranilate phosphoribosyltransferase [Solirubrobacteraceae bacterium]|nr:anthranilate phosphoribosyltransferase [Solirubrobacteraceae bacterium]